MDPAVSMLLAQIAALGQTITQQADGDVDSDNARQLRRDLIASTGKLCTVLQNPGLIAKQFLFSVVTHHSNCPRMQELIWL